MVTYDTHIPITLLRKAVADAAGVPLDSLPPYQRLYHRVLDGVIPAEQVGRRWYVRKDDLPAVIAALNIPAAAPIDGGCE